jgi:hypothetical protein
VAPLELTAAVPVPIKRAQPVALTWKAPGVAGLSRVKVYLDIAHYGGKKGEIDCDVADTGSFQIPAPLVTSLVDLGVAGFPTIVLTREARAASPTEAGVTLAISSAIERPVDTGNRDCDEKTPCPPGQTCVMSVYLCK